MTNPDGVVPPQNVQLPPLATRWDIAEVGGTGFVRFSFDHGIMSSTVCIPVADVLKFGGDLKRMCHDAEAAWKQEKTKLVLPAKGLLVPGQN